MKQKLFPTANSTPTAYRSQLVDLLNQSLADATDLASQAKQAHWNLKGPNFVSLHALFDEVYEAADSYVDDLAERAVQLGGTAYGTVRLAAQASRLEEYQLTAITGPQHVAALAKAVGTLANGVRASIAASLQLDDADTADLYTEISRGLDKLLWKLEASQQGG